MKAAVQMLRNISVVLLAVITRFTKYLTIYQKLSLVYHKVNLQ